jgi:hypothetical protein
LASGFLGEQLNSLLRRMGSKSSMKTKRTGAFTAATLALLFLLTAPVLVHADSQKSAPGTPLTLALSGGFMDIGRQHLSQSGGQLLSLFAPTLPTIDLSSAKLRYSIDASVRGTAVSGEATFTITGKNAAGDQVTIQGDAKLTDMIPAFGTPVDPSQPANPVACLGTALGCSSEVPAFLVGTATVQVHTSQKDTKFTLPMRFESAYLNPFGRPIVIASADATLTGYPTILIVAKYDKAISQWEKVSVGGFILDSTGTSLLGTFTMAMGITEDLRHGMEQDRGTISIASFSASFPSASGDFGGTSTIPPVPSPTPALLDCSITLGLPPGTCTLTGSHSTGVFNLQSTDHKSQVKGSYDINWTVPALVFGVSAQSVSTIIATVSKNSGG